MAAYDLICNTELKDLASLKIHAFENSVPIHFEQAVFVMAAP